MYRKGIHIFLAIIFILAMAYSYDIKTTDEKNLKNQYDMQKEIQNIFTENIVEISNQNEAVLQYTENIQQNTIKEKVNEITIKKIEKQEDKIIGIIKINKINFEGTVYEGTTGDILNKGVGHFKNSPYLNGNVCLAAHNTNTFWADLKTLEKGDLIVYESFLGTKEYEVYQKKQIDETDWLELEDTNENILTLITCVKGVREKRLCVQAREKI